jgi:ketosteroid isomerase-like protein
MEKPPMRHASRAIVIAFALLLTFSTVPAAQAQADASSISTTDRQQLLIARESVWRSFYSNDAEKLRALVPPDLIAINPGDPNWQSRNQFIASAQDFANHHGRLISLEFPKTEIQRFGDTAILFSLYMVDFEYDGKPQSLSGRTSEIFHRENGAWINTSWHIDSGK